jgi:hypothetical protein
MASREPAKAGKLFNQVEGIGIVFRASLRFIIPAQCRLNIFIYET